MAQQLTEEQVERRVERMTDNMDRRLMNGTITQDAYNKEVADLNRWANAQYDKARVWDNARARA